MSAVESAVAEAINPAQLPVPQRAALALRSAETEKELQELAEKHKDIVAITNPDGREQVHRAYMTLKNARIAVEKRGKEARADATAYSKAVIAEEGRLLALITPEETRLGGIRDNWDKEQERIRQEAIEREQRRVAAIRAEIEAIRAFVPVAQGRTAAQIEEYIEKLKAVALDEATFAEWLGEASTTHLNTLTTLMTMRDEAIEAEALAERQAEERRQQEARVQAEREAEAARIAAETKRLQEERERLAAERAEQERLAAEERARLQAERDAAEKAEAERQARLRQEEEAREAARRAEQEERDRQEAARQEQLRREQEERDRAETERQARIREEEERLARQRRENEQHAAYLKAVERINEIATRALAATELQAASDACNELICVLFDPAVYGDRAGDLKELSDSKYASICVHCDALQAKADAEKTLLTPPPAAADELTAAPSNEGAESATAAAEPAYPGDEQIEQGLAAQFGVSHLTARLWLRQYAEQAGHQD